MSIAEKLITVAENDQIITEAVATEADLISEIQSMVDNLPEAGGGDNLFQYVGQLSSTFHSATFPDGYELAISVPGRNHITLNQLIYAAKGLRKLTITDSPIAEVKSYFGLGGCLYIEEIDLSNFVQGGGAVVVTDGNYMFYDDKKLRAVYGELDFSAGVGLVYAFSNCQSLEEIRIKAGTLNKDVTFASCSNLSDASIQSIVDGLADLTGQTAQTLTLHATVGAKLTEAQKSTIAAKNWTVTY